ncbi:hypothetical protein [Moorena sp. SIO4G3]|uniref:hypothetical protein n=1 Tax=Moorena sp. SIO4G3 TaxID=2607821 RepID=UPI00142CB495|nr:hypothetical protein [Moorena sp. SIO4G3]NEO75177.1 hypothetical protein [Moorena sp. SIO4G3]
MISKREKSNQLNILISVVVERSINPPIKESYSANRRIFMNNTGYTVEIDFRFRKNIITVRLYDRIITQSPKDLSGFFDFSPARKWEWSDGSKNYVVSWVRGQQVKDREGVKLTSVVHLQQGFDRMKFYTVAHYLGL